MVQSSGASSSARARCALPGVVVPVAQQVHRESPLGTGELQVERRRLPARRELVVGHRLHAVDHPAAQRVVVDRRLDLGEVLELVVGRRDRRRAHEAVVLVDPDRGGHVDDAVGLGPHVVAVDEDRVGERNGGLLTRRRSAPASRCSSSEIGDHLEPLRCELVVQLLPDRQVPAAASPRGPRDEQLLAAREGR